MRLLRVCIVAVFVLTVGACTDQPKSDGQRHRPSDAADANPEHFDAADTDADAADSNASDTGQGADVDVDASVDSGFQQEDAGADDAGTQDAGAEDATPDVPLDKGRSIGTFWNTYYYLADEAGYGGADDTTLYDPSCDPIAEVPSDFADAACIEGSARLENGVVINYHSPCSCGPCSFCWSQVDPTTHPWGLGSQGNALKPLRSWAVDTDIIPYGTNVYVEQWDGVDIPQIGTLGGFVHDGCFRADDIGGGINGQHFDIFAGTPAMWQALEGIFATRTDFTVYVESPRCGTN
jgi:3D (Asp-Asp-Asp) domain-containing protein